MVRIPASIPALWFAATLCGSAALAGIALWVYSHAQRPFDYMVVGTFGATAILALAFVALVRRKML
jgi:hypothetical protein